MAKRRNSLTVYDRNGKVVAQLSFRKECTPEIWLKPGFTYLVRDEEPAP